MTGELGAREKRGGDWTGYCDRCGKQSSPSRRAARTRARSVPGGVHMSSYPCPHNPNVWHIGHLPPRVRQGTLERRRYLRGEFPASVEVVGMAVQVTWTDPRDAARCVDALMAAAILAHDRGNLTLAARYVKLGDQLADACDHSAVPPLTDVDDMLDVHPIR